MEASSTITDPAPPPVPAKPKREPVEYVVLREHPNDADGGVALYELLGRGKGLTKREAIRSVVIGGDGQLTAEGPFRAITARVWDATEDPKVKTEAKVAW